MPHEGGVYDQDPFLMEGILLVQYFQNEKQEFEQQKSSAGSNKRKSKG